MTIWSVFVLGLALGALTGWLLALWRTGRRVRQLLNTLEACRRLHGPLPRKPGPS